MAELVLENLTKRFGSTTAVVDVNLTVRDRELVVLVGPSGCGKTTTLRMIAGLERATAGQIRLDGRLLNRLAPKDRDISMVFQNYALYPHLNVYRNMAFGLRLRDTPRAEVDRRVRHAARLMHIESLLERRPAALSGGQQQRVAVGRAIVRQPQLFLLDEPLSNLDATLRAAMRTELVNLQQRLETTMVHVTHDQFEAMAMGDRIVVMHDGGVQQVGTPRTLYDWPINQFVAQFIGPHPMQFLPGTVVPRDEGIAVVVDGLCLPQPETRQQALAPWTGHAVTVGVRPEHISLSGRSASHPVRISGSVLRTQHLGAETLVQISWGRHRLTVRSDASPRWQPGDSLGLFLDPAGCYLFNPAGGRAIFQNVDGSQTPTA
jgi:multiple sugar transport system ATP-binding protein